MQSTFLYDKINILPKNVDIEKVVVISGKGTSSNIRDVKRLVSQYGGNKEDWEKMTGMIYGNAYKYEVHWYQKNGVQYDMKLKDYPVEIKRRRK